MTVFKWFHVKCRTHVDVSVSVDGYEEPMTDHPLLCPEELCSDKDDPIYTLHKIEE